VFILSFVGFCARVDVDGYFSLRIFDLCRQRHTLPLEHSLVFSLTPSLFLVFTMWGGLTDFWNIRLGRVGMTVPFIFVRDVTTISSAFGHFNLPLDPLTTSVFPPSGFPHQSPCLGYCSSHVLVSAPPTDSELAPVQPAREGARRPQADRVHFAACSALPWGRRSFETDPFFIACHG